MMDENNQQDMVPNSMAETPDGVNAQTESTSETQGQSEQNFEMPLPEMPLDSITGEPSNYGNSVSSEDVAEAGEMESSVEMIGQLNQELAAIAQANESLKAQLDDVSGQYRRLAADFENFRKRTQKEKEDLEVNIRCNTIKHLLPVIDNFERARSQLKPQTDGEMNIHKSYQGVYKQMVDGLKQLGVSAMRPEGEPFDPNLHEAVMREPTDQHPEGTVIEELMRGYMLGERILRHAMVKVATAPEPGSSSEATSEESVDG